MKLKIYKCIFTILVIIVIIVIGLIAMKYYRNTINEQENKKVVDVFSRNVENPGKENTTMNGYNVIGIVKIPKIELEYPILDIEASNPEETKEPMKISIVKYWGGKVNEFGNLSIAGHNNYDGTMFGKTKKLEIKNYLISFKHIS